MLQDNISILVSGSTMLPSSNNNSTLVFLKLETVGSMALTKTERNIYKKKGKF